MAFIYQPKPKWTGRAWLLTILFSLGMLVGGLLLFWLIIQPTRGTELAVPARPIDGDISRFGTYSQQYLERRWRRMCSGPARYDAMREAYERGLPQPCR